MSTYTVVIPVTNDLPARTVISVPVRAATRERAARAARARARAEGYGIDPSRVTRTRRAR
jgi:hypothetical protein